LYHGHDPRGLATAYRDSLGLNTIYVADLDAIEEGRPNVAILGELSGLGFDAWVDLGSRDTSSLAEIRTLGPFRWILATETMSGPALISDAVKRFEPDSLVFGLDLVAGRPQLAVPSAWKSTDSLDLVETAIAAGIRHVLLLDLARVGSGKGIGTLSLVVTLLRRLGPLDITVGGGVSSADDIKAASDAGATGVLIGSALHDGRIGASNLRFAMA
jgi:phosphoribosylformimino-5-aminoimidazole carboxamide ribotide isomerase